MTVPRRADPSPLRAGTPRAAAHVESARIDPGGERGRGPWLLILGAALLVALAVAKPWQSPLPGPAPGAGGAGGRPAGGAADGVAPSPIPSPRSADDIAAARCSRPLGWRTYAFETWHGQRIRTWTVVEPLVATELDTALDPRIPVVPIIGQEITALGYCAPVVEVNAPPASVSVTVWSVEPSGIVHALDVRRIEPLRPSSLSALFAYPDPAPKPGVLPPWPAGRYVFAILGEPDSGWGRWFAVQVVPFP
jgi:hypothetical protein